MRRSFWVLMGLIGCELLWLSSAMAAPKQAAEGYRFPALRVRYTQRKKRWRMYIRRFHFTKIVGKKPFVLLYFLPGHAPSEVELRALDALQKKWKKQIDCLAIAPIRRYHDIKKVVARLKHLRVDLPVLLDERKQLSYVTLTRRVPSYTAVSKSGYLRLTNAASLTELVRPGVTTTGFLQALIKGKPIPYTRAPGFSPNPYKWVGKTMQPWTTHAFGETQKRSLTQHLKKQSKTRRRATLVVFWSVTCDHCRRLLKHLHELLGDGKQPFSVLSFVQADKPAIIKRLKLFSRRAKLSMPILMAPKGKLFDRYHALTLPTMLLIDQRGAIKAVQIGTRPSGQHLIAKLTSALQAKPAPAPRKPKK